MSLKHPTVVAVDAAALGEATTFGDGSTRSVARLGPTWMGHGTYLPGWRWSEHVQPSRGRPSESHAGYVVSGRLVVLGPDGTEVTVGPGEAFFAVAGHDAWVEGDEPCVALDFPLETAAG
jgi:hypothetical protein